MRTARRSQRCVLTAALTFLAAAGCAGEQPPQPAPVTSSPAHRGSDQVDEPVEMPDSPVGRQARWVIDQLGQDGGPTADEARERFSAAFLAEVSADGVADVFSGLRRDGPWLPVDVDAAGPDAIVRLHDGAGEPWRMVISVDGAGTVTTLFIRPETGGDEPAATSWAQIHERLTRLDAHVSLLAARVGEDGRCETITEIDAERVRPLASIFKLYVLGALTDAVSAGEADWTDQLTITDDARSLPSGELQKLPDGSEVSVSEAAAGMIAISDNTGADLLIDLVGRDAVETAMADMGHADPATNEPLLTTRDFFTIGWGDPELRAAWHSADTAEREEIVDSLPGGALAVTAADVTDPAWNSRVGWFGSAADICAALVSLHAAGPEESGTQMLRTILGHNRGVSIDRDQWPYVAYKGGSAPGVLTGSWYGERRDGERYVYVMQAAARDAAALEDHAAFFELAEDAFRLLTQE